ncbi:unnamed protein product [Menidia menidia]|uniref:(Atlantic silverside) hypothetical protein n=1 Tax=Menidia menidia TaxID=238744 RepID=A0A8S4BCF9_9TELE|nr:unnamed protein product [Menidia menidia]
MHHFETKVEKHSHYQEQLELSHQKLQHVETLGDEEHIRRNQQKYDSLAEKTREMGYKMKKHMQDLSNKISRQGLQHNELLAALHLQTCLRPGTLSVGTGLFGGKRGSRRLSRSVVGVPELVLQLNQPVLDRPRPPTLSRFHGSQVEVVLLWSG